MAGVGGNTAFYEHYRGSSIGTALTDALDDLINDGARISPQLAMKILSNFDKAVSEVLSNERLVKSRMSFKGHLDNYRFCDDVWTFVVKDVNFKLDNVQTMATEKIKIVSCSSKKPGDAEKESTRS